MVRRGENGWHKNGKCLKSGSAVDASSGRPRFKVELQPKETTIVSWTKLLREAHLGYSNRMDANKCNVGYAFINLLSPSYIIPFYEALNGKRWKKFNSEKIASLANTRIQGKCALVAHFEQSTLMKEEIEALEAYSFKPRLTRIQQWGTLQSHGWR